MDSLQASRLFILFYLNYFFSQTFCDKVVVSQWDQNETLDT